MYQILLVIHVAGYAGSIGVLSYIAINSIRGNQSRHAKSATISIVALQSLTGSGLYIFGNHTESLLGVCLKSGAFLLLHAVAYSYSRRLRQAS